MKAYIETRSQKQVGTWPNVGPDTYVAVQVVPEGVKPLRVLNHRVARMRGIKIIYCGEGYSKNCKTERSSLVQARMEAERIVKEINTARNIANSLGLSIINKA